MAATTARLLLPVAVAAQRLGFGRSLAWRLVRSGELPSVTADAQVARCANMAASPRRAIRDLPLLPQRRRSFGRTTAYGASLPTSLA